MISNSEIMRPVKRDQDCFPDFPPQPSPPDRRRQGLDLKKQAHEEMIRLVRQLFFSGPASPQVVIFSAVEHGSGCTWISARVADALAAHVDGLVCLVDADLRSPSLHRQYNIDAASKVVGEEFLYAPVRRNGGEPGGSNLWLLSGGGTDSQEPHYFERLRSRIPELRKDFTYVLIDAPPVNAYADAALLGALADGAVLILGANETRREAALRAKETLEAAGIRLLGAVLNKRTFPIPEKLYWNL